MVSSAGDGQESEQASVIASMAGALPRAVPHADRRLSTNSPWTGTTTQGETVEEAIANLKEATVLYLSEFPLPAMGHPVITMFTVPTPAHA